MQVLLPPAMQALLLQTTQVLVQVQVLALLLPPFSKSLTARSKPLVRLQLLLVAQVLVTQVRVLALPATLVPLLQAALVPVLQATQAQALVLPQPPSSKFPMVRFRLLAVPPPRLLAALKHRL